MNKEEYKNIYQNEHSFWWYRILDDLVEYFVAIYGKKNPIKILDAGCGTGRVMSRLSKFGAVSGIDASPIAVEMCQSRGLSDVKIADLNQWSAENEFTIIVSLDVLYHKSVTDIDKIMHSFNKALCPGGILIMNLPAFKILRRAHDEIVGGDKRFRKREIKNILTGNGFQVHTISYRYVSLFIFILLRKLFGEVRKKPESDLARLSAPVNGSFYLLHRIENEIIKTGFSIPLGSSLFVVARKRSDNQKSPDNSQAYAQNNLFSKATTYIRSITILNQLLRYSIVGIFNTVFGLGVIYLLFNLFHFNYILSNIGGYSVGLINGFIWNKKWTFESRRTYFKEILPYLTVFGISYAANLIAVVFFVEALKIHPNIAQVLGIAAYSLTNFVVNKYWTFSKVR